MKIIEKINEKARNLKHAPPITIAFLGDSVTQGCFDLYCCESELVETYFDAENAYHTKLKRIFSMLYPNVPINIINAGISGGKAYEAIERLDRDVLCFSPDLCVVCFGLNDSCGTEEDDFERYKTSMKKIFETLLAENIEVVFLTPNMMCTGVSCHIENDTIKGIAKNVSQMQLDGRLEQFLSAAVNIATNMNIPICDCYSKWKLLYDNGVNINELLSNHINHPTPEMNWMFAVSLVETIFREKSK